MDGWMDAYIHTYRHTYVRMYVHSMCTYISYICTSIFYWLYIHIHSLSIYLSIYLSVHCNYMYTFRCIHTHLYIYTQYISIMCPKLLGSEYWFKPLPHLFHVILRPLFYSNDLGSTCTQDVFAITDRAYRVAAFHAIRPAAGYPLGIQTRWQPSAAPGFPKLQNTTKLEV